MPMIRSAGGFLNFVLLWISDVKVQRDRAVTTMLGHEILDIVATFRQSVAFPNVLLARENRLLIFPMSKNDKIHDHNAVTAVLVIVCSCASEPAYGPCGLEDEHLVQKIRAHEEAVFIVVVTLADSVTQESGV